MRLDVDPFIIQLGFLNVRWYGFFMAFSILVGTIYLYRRGTQKGLSEDFIANLVLMVVVGGVVGARLMFVASNFPAWFWESPLKVVEVWKGGLSWHGGLLGGFLPGWWYCRRERVNVHEVADLAVPGLALGYMLVRIGNIFNQEVMGRYTELWFEQWPAQLVGSAIGLVLLVRYLLVQKGNPYPGYQFWSFVFYHQLLRAIIEESVRNNSLFGVSYVNEFLGIGVLTLTQWTTVPILLLAWWMLKRAKTAALQQHG